MVNIISGMRSLFNWFIRAGGHPVLDPGLSLLCPHKQLITLPILTTFNIYYNVIVSERPVRPFWCTLTRTLVR